MTDDRTLTDIDNEFGMTSDEVAQMRKDIQFGRMSPPIRADIVRCCELCHEQMPANNRQSYCERCGSGIGMLQYYGQ